MGCVFIGHFLFKYQAIVNDLLINDDLFQVSHLILGGDFRSPSRPVYSLLFTWIFNSFEAIFLPRMLFLCLMSVSAYISFLILDKYIGNKQITAISIIVAYLNPFTNEMVNYISGSQVMLAYFFSSIALYLSSLYIFKDKGILSASILALFSTVLFVFGGHTHNGLYLFPLLLLAFPWIKMSGKNKIKLLPFAFNIIMPLFTFAYFLLFKNATYHYYDRGKIVISISNMLNQLFSAFEEAGIIFYMTLEGKLFEIILIFIITFFLLYFLNIDFKRKKAGAPFYFFIFSFAALAFSATSVLTVFVPRHLYLSSLPVAFLLCTELLRIRNKYIRNGIIALFFSLNSGGLIYLQEIEMNKFFPEYNTLKHLISKESPKWNKNPYVFVEVQDPAFKHRLGSKNAGSSFMRMVSGRKDIVSNIGYIKGSMPAPFLYMEKGKLRQSNYMKGVERFRECYFYTIDSLNYKGIRYFSVYYNDTSINYKLQGTDFRELLPGEIINRNNRITWKVNGNYKKEPFPADTHARDELSFPEIPYQFSISADSFAYRVAFKPPLINNQFNTVGFLKGPVAIAQISNSICYMNGAEILFSYEIKPDNWYDSEVMYRGGILSIIINGAEVYSEKIKSLKKIRNITMRKGLAKEMDLKIARFEILTP